MGKLNLFFGSSLPRKKVWRLLLYVVGGLFFCFSHRASLSQIVNSLLNQRFYCNNMNPTYRKTSVTFDESRNTFHCSTERPGSREEKRQLWYSSEDYKAMLGIDLILLQMNKAGRPFDQDADCLRGLEAHFRHAAIRSVRARAVGCVLRIQMTQQQRNIHDPVRIAEVYQLISERPCELAHEMGLEDAEAVAPEHHGIGSRIARGTRNVLSTTGRSFRSQRLTKMWSNRKLLVKASLSNDEAEAQVDKKRGLLQIPSFSGLYSKDSCRVMTKSDSDSDNEKDGPPNETGSNSDEENKEPRRNERPSLLLRRASSRRLQRDQKSLADEAEDTHKEAAPKQTQIDRRGQLLGKKWSSRRLVKSSQ